MIFFRFLYYFVDIDVLDIASRSRAILDPKMSKNGPNLGVKRESKSIKNRYRRGIKIWIDFGSDFERPKEARTKFSGRDGGRGVGPLNGINRRLYRRRSIYRSISDRNLAPRGFTRPNPGGSGRI